jgi:hypothetical protein
VAKPKKRDSKRSRRSIKISPEYLGNLTLENING